MNENEYNIYKIVYKIKNELIFHYTIKQRLYYNIFTSYMNYGILIFFAYVFGGCFRGFVVNILSTEVIRMYSYHSVPFDYQNRTIIAVLSSAVLIGSVLVAFAFNPIIKKLGRRNTLMWSAVFGVISNALSYVPWHWAFLAVTRAIAGAASSMIMTVMPMLFSEFVPPKSRGVYATLMGLFIAVGLLGCYVLLYFIIDAEEYYYVVYAPSIVCAMGVFFVCLFVKEGTSSYESMAAKNVQTKTTDRLCSKKYLKCYIVALSICVQNTGSGFFAIIQYATMVFKNAFNSPKSAAIGGIIVASISLGFSISSLLFVRIINRRPLIIFGMIAMSAAHVMYIVVYFVDTNYKMQLMITAATLFLAAFQNSDGALVFVILGEVFPLDVKTRFTNIGMMGFWIAIIFVIFIYPLVDEWVNHVFYLVFILVPGVLLIKYLPETRNKTLEEIEKLMLLGGAKVQENKSVAMKADVLE